ncbi:mitochondrial small ribosomal subunit Rsm22-domain-containing protein [Powellomyces hirtus]|nr:mitochondrial small ribosomal subunit Rsm22-domain-containing protein [Powellomyces hirtus]
MASKYFNHGHVRHKSTKAVAAEGTAEEGKETTSAVGGRARFSPEVLFGKNKIGWIGLPEELLASIDSELAGTTIKPRQLKRDVERIHSSLRSTGSAAKLIKYATSDGRTRVPLIEPHTIQYGPLETKAYVASRTVPAYAAAINVMTQVATRCPDFAPTSCMDFATGPGTALWAANRVWDSITENVGIDLSEAMLAAGVRIAETNNAEATAKIRNLSTRRYLSSSEAAPESDLVIANFALGDLASDAIRKTTIESLWNQTGDVLVLIERGTPEGFKRIATARAMILAKENKKLPVAENVHVVVPCPHSQTCPMLAQSSWCHFSQRIQRSRHMMMTAPNHVLNNHQDIKFSYVVLRRGPKPTATAQPQQPNFVTESFNWPRIIAPPMKRDKHVVMDMCASSGRLERINVSKGKSGKAIYYEARKSAWGDIWPHKPVGTVVVKEPKKSDDER